MAALADPACGLESKLEGGLPGGVVESPVVSTVRSSSHKIGQEKKFKVIKGTPIRNRFSAGEPRGDEKK